MSKIKVIGIILLNLMLASISFYGMENIVQGQWKLYWKQLVTNDTATSYQTKTLPHSWIGLAKKENAELYATYIRVLTNLNPSQIYGLHTPYIENSFNIYVDKKLISKVGNVSSNQNDYKAQRKSQIVYFKPSSTHAEIIVQIASFKDYANTLGFYKSMELGRSDEIERFGMIRILLSSLILIILVYVSIYHFLLYIIRRKDIAFLFFSILSISMAMRFFVIDDCLASILFQNISLNFMNRLENIGVLTTSIFTILTLKSIVDLKIKIFDYIIFFIYSIFIVINIVADISIYSQCTTAYLSAVLVAVFYSFGISVLALIRRKYNSTLMLIGYGIFCVAAINDIFNYLGILHNPDFSTYGMFVQIIFQTIALARVFADTKDLNEKIETQNRALDLKNKQMTKELKIGQMVQNSLLGKLPGKLGDISIYLESHPYSEVSGDFFSVVKTRDDKFYMFFGDVSGHGISAALVTILAKNLFSDVVRQNLNSEADLSTSTICEKLNVSLMSQLEDSGIYITGFVIKLNINTGEVEYTNAGHTNPYLYKKVDDSFSKLFTNDTVLGITDTTYHSKSLQLSKGDRLLMYTDGIYEAKNEREELYIDLIENDFNNLAKSELANIAKNMFDKANKFLENGKFNDDVTLISFEA